MNPIKQLAGQTAIYGLSSVVARILNYLLVPLYTRVFSTSEYGIVVELYAYVAILMVILTYGLETGYFRFTRDKGDEGSVFSTGLISLFTTASLFIILASFFAVDLAKFFGEGHQPDFIVLLAFIIGIDVILALPYAKLRYENKAVTFAVFKTINIGINILFNLFFLILNPLIEKHYPGNVLAVIFPKEFGVGYIFFSNLLASGINLLLFIPAFLKMSFSFRLTIFNKLIKYSFPLLIAGLGGIINETIDRVLLKYRLDELGNPLEQLGIYGANIKIAVFMTLFVQMYRYAAEPFFFNQYSKSKEDFLESYAFVNRVFLYAGLFVFLGIVYFLDVFKYFIGSDFRGGLGIVPIVLGSNLLLGVFFNLSFWYKLNDKTWYGAYLTIFGAGITVAINYFYIPVYGYYASAWAHVICNFSMVLLSFYFSQKISIIDFRLIRVLYIVLTTAVLFSVKKFFVAENYLIELLMRIILLSIFIFTVLRIEKIGIDKFFEIIKNKKENN